MEFISTNPFYVESESLPIVMYYCNLLAVLFLLLVQFHRNFLLKFWSLRELVQTLKNKLIPLVFKVVGERSWEAGKKQGEFRTRYGETWEKGVDTAECDIT